MQGQSKDKIAHHPAPGIAGNPRSWNADRSLDRSPINMEFLLNATHNTSTNGSLISDSEAQALASPLSFEPLLTPAEGANLLGIHAKTLIKMARGNMIQAIRIGKHWRFRASWINTYIANQLQSSRQPA